MVSFNLLGSSEMLMAAAVDRAAAETPGKEARAMEAFAHALRQLPATIAENGGYDSAQLVSELRALHTKGQYTMGLGKNEVFFSLVERGNQFLMFADMNNGIVGDMSSLGITESYSVKRQVLLSASEAAEMILRVDDIIKAAPRKREVDRGHC